jgi:wyosine [tRNA(Phe)-imidazoG37] synthetase (radical SAM superfamily)
MQVDRTQFYDPEKIYRDVRKKVEKAQRKGESVDYLTFVPDGEPTLDANLGQEIDLLKSLGLKIAVITNGSLIWRKDVREDLAKADWVSFKIDSTSEKTWRRINRPHKTLKMAAILGGLLEFAERYSGKLVTETMLLQNINDSANSARKIAGFLKHLQPVKVYLAVPTRPPVEKWVRPPDEDVLNETFQILNEKPFKVEYLIGYEGNAFAFTGNVKEDLLSITAVHPMRQDAVNKFLMRAGVDCRIIEKLMAQGQIVETKYRGQLFYMRTVEP